MWTWAARPVPPVECVADLLDHRLTAAAVKGLSGFGYALIATPQAAVLIDPAVAVVVLAVPSLVTNLFQVGETGTGWTYLKQRWPLVTAALVGSVIGVFILTTFPAKNVLGLVIGQMTLTGTMTPQLVWLGSVISLVTLVGLAAGTALRRWGRVDAKVFQAVVLILLAATGVAMLVKAAMHHL